LRRLLDLGPAPQRRGARAHLRSLLDVHDPDALLRADLPWWTYRATDAADALLAERGGQARAFEYGSGASTVWLARRCSSVVSVEHDREWASLVRARLDPAADVQLHLVPGVPATAPDAVLSGRREAAGLDFADYVRTIDRVGGLYDVVVVDGRARTACLAAALPHLAEDGFIVFDNTHRRRYASALSACPLPLRRYRGAAPGLPYPEETSLLGGARALPC